MMKKTEGVRNDEVSLLPFITQRGGGVQEHNDEGDEAVVQADMPNTVKLVDLYIAWPS